MCPLFRCHKEVLTMLKTIFLNLQLLVRKRGAGCECFCWCPWSLFIILSGSPIETTLLPIGRLGLQEIHSWINLVNFLRCYLWCFVIISNFPIPSPRVTFGIYFGVGSFGDSCTKFLAHTSTANAANIFQQFCMAAVPIDFGQKRSTYRSFRYSARKPVHFVSLSLNSVFAVDMCEIVRRSERKYTNSEENDL